MVIEDTQIRLAKLKEYHLLDFKPDSIISDMPEIVARLCGSPFVYISIFSASEEVILASKGLDVSTIPLEKSVVHHLDDSRDITIVDFKDELTGFSETYSCQGKNAAFCAAAPLKTPDGILIGLLSFLDTGPVQTSDEQKGGLEFLARKVMDYLQKRKLLIDQEQHIDQLNREILDLLDDYKNVRLLDKNITESEEFFRNICNNSQITLYAVKIEQDKEIKMLFWNKGLTPGLKGYQDSSFKTEVKTSFEVIHPDDQELVKASLDKSIRDLSARNIDYRVLGNDGQEIWVKAQSKPMLQADGSIIMYGSVIDISKKKEYENELGRIIFDISHVIRRPITTMMGLCQLISEECPGENNMEEYIGYLNEVMLELDTICIKLNNYYQSKKNKLKEE